MLCPNCKQETSSILNYCEKCGADLESISNTNKIQTDKNFNIKKGYLILINIVLFILTISLPLLIDIIYKEVNSSYVRIILAFSLYLPWILLIQPIICGGINGIIIRNTDRFKKKFLSGFFISCIYNIIISFFLFMIFIINKLYFNYFTNLGAFIVYSLLPIIFSAIIGGLTARKITLEKRRSFILFLCILTGIFGVHRFYVGKIGTAFIILILTIFAIIAAPGTKIPIASYIAFSIVSLFIIIDIICILIGKFTDKDGNYLLKW